MATYPSDSSDDYTAPNTKLFRRERPLHEALGGGKVADILLWRDRRVSGAILSAVAGVWYLFEVVEYNFVTLLCHILITTMLLLFIWSTGAHVFGWSPPKIPEMLFQESTFINFASILHKNLNKFLPMFFEIACGYDAKLFLVAMLSLWILSLIGNCISTLNLLFLGILCVETLPIFYEKYEEEVEDYAGKMYRQMRKMYKRIDNEYLRKIPRGPVKEKET
nr:reticulon-like protein B9 [Ipomoea batatas]